MTSRSKATLAVGLVLVGLAGAIAVGQSWQPGGSDAVWQAPTQDANQAVAEYAEILDRLAKSDTDAETDGVDNDEVEVQPQDADLLVTQVALERCLGDSLTDQTRARLRLEDPELLAESLRISSATQRLVSITPSSTIERGDGCVGGEPWPLADAVSGGTRHDGSVECASGQSPQPVRLIYSPGPAMTLSAAARDTMELLEAITDEADSLDGIIANVQVLYNGYHEHLDTIASLRWSPGRHEAGHAVPGLDDLAGLYEGAIPPAPLVEAVLDGLFETEPMRLEPSSMASGPGSDLPTLYVTHGRGLQNVQRVREWFDVPHKTIAVAVGDEAGPDETTITLMNDPVLLGSGEAQEPDRVLAAQPASRAAIESWSDYRSIVIERFGAGTAIGHLFSPKFDENVDPVAFAQGLAAAQASNSTWASEGVFLDAMRLAQLGMLSAHTLQTGYLERSSPARTLLVSSIADELQALACGEATVRTNVQPKVSRSASLDGLAQVANGADGVAWRLDEARQDTLVVAVTPLDGCQIDANLMVRDETGANLLAGTDTWLGDNGCQTFGPIKLSPRQLHDVVLMPTDRDRSIESDTEYEIRFWVYAASKPRSLDPGTVATSALEAPLANDVWILEAIEWPLLVNLRLAGNQQCGVGLNLGLSSVLSGSSSGSAGELKPLTLEQSCDEMTVVFDADFGGQAELHVGLPQVAALSEPLRYEVRIVGPTGPGEPFTPLLPESLAPTESDP